MTPKQLDLKAKAESIGFCTKREDASLLICTGGSQVIDATTAERLLNVDVQWFRDSLGVLWLVC